MSARRARHLLAPLAAAIALVAAAPAAAAPPDPAPLLLRLPDLPEGYGRAVRCAELALEGDDSVPRPLRELYERVHPRGCAVEFDRVWQAPSPSAPSRVMSFAFSVADAADAAAMVDHARALAWQASRLPLDAWAEQQAPAPVGDETRLLRTETRLPLLGLKVHGAVVVWRSGAVVGLVFGGGQGAAEPADTEQALRLAAAQQARIAAPAPVLPTDFDAAEVPLDDPSLDMPVLWLGRELSARDGRPALSLRPTFGLIEPGARVQLDYGSRHRLATVRVSLWKPRRLRRALRRELRDPSCVRRYDGGPAGIRATIYGSSSFVGEHCEHPPRRPSHYTAVAYFPGVAVTIDAEHWRAYDSPAGLRALLRALRLRPSTP